MSWRAQIQNVRTQWNPRSSDGTLRSRRGVPAQSQRSGLCGERTSNEVSEPCRMRQGERYEVCEDALKGLGCCPARKSEILYRGTSMHCLASMFDHRSQNAMTIPRPTVPIPSLPSQSKRMSRCHIGIGSLNKVLLVYQLQSKIFAVEPISAQR